jgi:hypothetical protein
MPLGGAGYMEDPATGPHTPEVGAHREDQDEASMRSAGAYAQGGAGSEGEGEAAGGADLMADQLFIPNYHCCPLRVWCISGRARAKAFRDWRWEI